MKVRLTKLKDLAFEGEHPRGINQGAVREGVMVKLPVIGGTCMAILWSTSNISHFDSGKNP